MSTPDNARTRDEPNGESKDQQIQQAAPVINRWVRISRYLPWVSKPWESEHWKISRWTRTAVMWWNTETRAEVHLEPDEDGWRVVATSEHDAPTGQTFHPQLTPEPTSRDTTLYLAEQYMKNGVGLGYEQAESQNPPRLRSFEGQTDAE